MARVTGRVAAVMDFQGRGDLASWVAQRRTNAPGAKVKTQDTTHCPSALLLLTVVVAVVQ
jgi:hypothetical protein